MNIRVKQCQRLYDESLRKKEKKKKGANIMFNQQSIQYQINRCVANINKVITRNHPLSELLLSREITNSNSKLSHILYLQNCY